MIQILDEIITDKNFAWDNTLQNKIEKFYVELTDAAIDELLKNKINLEENYENLVILQNEIKEFKKILVSGCGFFVINNSCFSNFSEDEKKSIFSIICKILGTLYVQNIKNEKYVVITDEGKSMKTGGRYHQTKEGGSFHTDSPQWSKTPDYIAMLCLHPAKTGGTSKFLSAYSIHNQMFKENRILLEQLYNKFHFDKRNEYKKNESPTVFEPIFKYENKNLTLRYLRNYIDKGHEIQKQTLTKIQIKSLDLLDKISHNDDISVNYDLKSDDMVFFNNNRVLHGRTSFEDHEDPNQKRYLIRAWIKDNN